jgi:hypothetical protein
VKGNRPAWSFPFSFNTKLNMAAFRFSRPICQTRDWHEIEDGTLVRMPSPLPVLALEGQTGAQGGTQAGAQGATQGGTNVTATGNCAYLNPRTSGTVAASSAAFTRLRRGVGAANYAAAQAVASHSWPDGTSSAAESYELIIDRQTIEVIRPLAANATGKNLPSNAQLGEALRAIPSGQRVLTKKVVISPQPHPDSTATQTVAGSAGSGTITLFPVKSGQTQDDFDNRVMHESGHNYQGHLWHSGQAVADWGNAAKQDKRLPSPYAGSNFGDDFCEFHILFNAARGTPCEAIAVQLYPNRWAKMLTY